MPIKIFTLVITALSLAGCSSVGQEDFSCPHYLTSTTAQHCVDAQSIQTFLTSSSSSKNIKEL